MTTRRSHGVTGRSAEAGDTSQKISYVFRALPRGPNRSPSPSRPHGAPAPRPDRLHIAKLRPWHAVPRPKMATCSAGTPDARRSHRPPHPPPPCPRAVPYRACAIPHRCTSAKDDPTSTDRASTSWCHRPEAGDTSQKISYVFRALPHAPHRSPSTSSPHGTSAPRPDRLHVAKLRT